MAWLNDDLGGLGDPLIWQALYVKYGWLDLNAGKDWSAGSNYKYLLAEVTADTLNKLGSETPPEMTTAQAVSTPEGRENLVRWQSNWMNQREPYKSLFAAKNILVPQTVSTGQEIPPVGESFNIEQFFKDYGLYIGLGVGGYLLYTKYGKKGGVAHGTT